VAKTFARDCRYYSGLTNNTHYYRGTWGEVLLYVHLLWCICLQNPFILLMPMLFSGWCATHQSPPHQTSIPQNVGIPSKSRLPFTSNIDKNGDSLGKEVRQRPEVQKRWPVANLNTMARVGGKQYDVGGIFEQCQRFWMIIDFKWHIAFRHYCTLGWNFCPR